MLLAFSWWSVLLFYKNRDAFLAKRELMKMAMIAEGIVKPGQETALLKSEEYLELASRYKRQEWMILGEALFFVLSLVIGIWFINRGYNKEVDAAQQRRNFLLSITHELKSPIASIRLVLETFLKRKLPEETFQKLGKNALKETERLNDLVNDLLLSAKLDESYHINPEPILLEEFINDIVLTMQSKYPEASFSFENKAGYQLVNLDEMGFASVIINLLENAVKYGTEKPIIDIQLKEEGGNIKLSIADQGIGIEDKEKKKVFQKFYRVGNEDTRKTKGTGLGLFIVEQIIKAHHGKISITDNQPRGTVFEILIPKTKEML